MNTHSPYTKFSIIKKLDKIIQYSNPLVIFCIILFGSFVFTNNPLMANNSNDGDSCASPENSKSEYCQELTKKIKADRDKAEKDANGSDKLDCDRARENSKDLESDIRSSDACPGGLNVKSCMEKARACSEDATLDTDNDTGSFLSSIAPAVGSAFGGQSSMSLFPMFASSVGGGTSGVKSKCQQTRSDWEAQKEQQDRLKEQMNDAQDKINDNLDSAQESLIDSQRNQKESLDTMADLVKEYRINKQTTKDQLNSKQLQFNDNLRSMVLDIQDLNGKILLAEKEMNNRIIGQQNLTVQFVDDCNNKLSEDKDNALIALETAKEEMEKTLASMPTNEDGKVDINEREQLKQSLIQKLFNARTTAENKLTEKYDKCMKENNRAYKAEFQKLGMEIEQRKHDIEMSKIKLEQLQAKLKDMYNAMTLEAQSIAEQSSAQLDAQANQLNNLQKALYDEAQNIMNQNNQVQQLQQQLQQQNVMSMMTNAGAVSMYGINSGMSAGTGATYLGLGSAAVYLDPYDTAMEVVAECDKARQDRRKNNKSSSNKGNQ